MNIDIRPDYTRHPKTKRLKKLIGPCADCYPVRLWLFLAEFSQIDGSFKDMNPSEIEAAADWDGDEGKLFSALIETKFIERIDGIYHSHGWIDHQGHFASYSKRGKAAARAKWDNNKMQQAQSRVCNTHASCMPHACNSDAPAVLALPVIPTIPTISATKDKKQREGSNIPPNLDEVKEYFKKTSCNVDPESFYHHYTANGWMIGKNKMKNWHSAVATWVKRDFQPKKPKYEDPGWQPAGPDPRFT